ncbi:MAG TPA: dienelactone hydrolase family protein [Dehalococcoidia bacterium]|nr:dienelactone hydrolase family protein [Dehalococcoidia bacterium]
MASAPGAVLNEEAIESGKVTFPAADGVPFEGFLARPKAPGTYPGVIVIHGVVGLNDHYRDLARRFANAGFIALSPNIYSRVGNPTPGDQQSAFAKGGQLNDSGVVSDLEAAVRFLNAQEGASGKIGVIGFSAGGRQTLLFACNSGNVSAAVDCWGGFLNRANPQAETTPGRPKRILDMIPDLNAPLLAIFGADDPSPTPAEAEELRERLQQAGKQGTIKVFEGAGHGFFNEGDANSYREAQAHEMWELVTAFFKQNLS